ncbi:MAG TPA: ACT domain-containing protein [Spirochaetia bacterium]|nr:ACT domain-containing protein [Spirochaetia bacterium]
MLIDKLILSVLPEQYAVCRLGSDEEMPGWVTGNIFFSITRTPDELSIICPQEKVPAEIECERSFRIIRVSGPLSLSLIGLIASISRIIANVGISLLSISTYETDYILVKDKDLDGAIAALSREGWPITVD